MFNPSHAAAPITKSEFYRLFTKCTPPSGWQPKIAVGNSGGPDSTCLLFLINRLLKDESMKSAAVLPTAAVSLSVDHNLQDTSASMAARSSQTAASLGIEHLTMRIPWSEKPFPPKPVTTAAFEEIARDARFHLLFDGLTRVGANVLALGHHIDDQVETSLMRLARGTTETGAAGMRRCRRWGMGIGSGNGDLGWAGLEGMRTWIVRPLLEISKDRILATCEENKLDYVHDPTNFQPELTLRNAIRKALTERDARCADQTTADTEPSSSQASDVLDVVKIAASKLETTIIDASGGVEQLRGAVKLLSSRVEDIDGQATAHIKRHTLPSPIGTFLLSSHRLSTIEDDSIRRAIILRIMRYVSFHPWGSLRADGNRRRSSIQRMISKIWTENIWEQQMSGFTAGGGVKWAPAILTARGKILTGFLYKQYSPKPGDQFGWLASRLPPISANGKNENLPPQLDVDVTDLVAGCSTAATGAGNSHVDVLFDCRFLVRFDLSQIPGEVRALLKNRAETGSTIRVSPHTKYFWPQVILRSPSQEAQILATVPLIEQARAAGKQNWIDIQWIRLLDAT